MFANLTNAPEGEVQKIMRSVEADRRSNKLDLSIGMFKDANGLTPIMKSVKIAEQRLVDQQTTKGYPMPLGNPEFLDLLAKLVIGKHEPVALSSAIGGTGALWQAMELVKAANQHARIWVSNISWSNHEAIARSLGLKVERYQYYDIHKNVVDVHALFDSLKALKAGDIFLAHGCCHNPTGADIPIEAQDQLIASLQEAGAVPLIDMAYLGFGDGLTEDAQFTRRLVSELPTVLIAVSCSKNFAIYQERTGALFVTGQDRDTIDKIRQTIVSVTRRTYSFCPEHGAEIVASILGDTDLRSLWQEELEANRRQVQETRLALAEELETQSGNTHFEFLKHQKGMFSLLGLTTLQVEELRTRFAIHLLANARVNLAGLPVSIVPRLASSICEVMGRD